VVRESLRLKQQVEELHTARLEALRRDLDTGIAELDRGERIPGEAAMAEILAGHDGVKGHLADHPVVEQVLGIPCARMVRIFDPTERVTGSHLGRGSSGAQIGVSGLRPAEAAPGSRAEDEDLKF
jgi:hypothetical protein